LRISLTFASALLIATPLLAQEQPAATAGARGVAAVDSVTAVATVEAIDQATREVTLRKENGEVVTLVVGEQARNLAQVQRGDRVTVTYTVGLLVGVGPPGGEPVRVEDTEVSRTPLGARPGGSVRQTVAVTATVLEIDRATRTVTLRGPRQTVELVISPDVDFSKLQVGERVGVVYEESMALTVEPAKE
jgi:Cu/Ag efflux protein CusF